MGPPWVVGRTHALPPTRATPTILGSSTRGVRLPEVSWPFQPIAVPPEDQVAIDFIREDLDRVGIGQLVVDKPHVSAQVIAVYPKPARVEPGHDQITADRAVVESAEDGTPNHSYEHDTRAIVGDCE